MPQTVDLRQEVAKLEEDVEWGSRRVYPADIFYLCIQMINFAGGGL